MGVRFNCMRRHTLTLVAHTQSRLDVVRSPGINKKHPTEKMLRLDLTEVTRPNNRYPPHRVSSSLIVLHDKIIRIGMKKKEEEWKPFRFDSAHLHGTLMMWPPCFFPPAFFCCVNEHYLLYDSILLLEWKKRKKNTAWTARSVVCCSNQERKLPLICATGSFRFLVFSFFFFSCLSLTKAATGWEHQHQPALFFSWPSVHTDIEWCHWPAWTWN